MDTIDSTKIVGTNVVITKTTEQTIPVKDLELEKQSLEAQIESKEPTDKELVDFAKQIHPYYMRKLDTMNARIEEINTMIGK